VLLQLGAEGGGDTGDPDDVLELIEGDHALSAVTFVQAQGQRQALQQGGGSRLRRDAEANTARRPAEGRVS
jgi:hypothetical protein